MTIYLGIDDTDSLESIGTGRLSRLIYDKIQTQFPVLAVTRHQFLVHPDIPYTSHNSGAVIWIDDISEINLTELFYLVSSIMRENYVEGSDPGIALAQSVQITAPVIAFGQDAKRIVLTKEHALRLADNTGIMLAGLGGTNGGVIGALAGVGLAASGYDGRFLHIGTIRDKLGDQMVTDILSCGIDAVMTTDGRCLCDGLIKIRKFPQPACMAGRPVLLVEEIEGEFLLVKRD